MIILILLQLAQQISGRAAFRTLNLTIIHTNDIHAYATEFKER